MFFDTSLTYLQSISHEDRKDIAMVVLDKKTRTTLTVANVVANIAIPAAVCIGSNCNLLFVFGAFVVTDIIMNTIDHYLTVIKPHQALRDGLVADAKKQFQIFQDKKNELDKKISDHDKSVRLKNLTPLEEYIGWQDERDALDTFLKYESEWFEKKLIPYKDEEIKNLQTPAKDYSDKRIFFAAFAGQVEQYITLYNINCLKPVAAATKSLMEILDTKPDGYEIVPQMLYVYINEFQKTLVKVSSLTNSQMKEHTEDLVKVSTALSKHINQLVEKIKNADFEEIDLSLSVLIQELEKELV